MAAHRAAALALRCFLATHVAVAASPRPALLAASLRSQAAAAATTSMARSLLHPAAGLFARRGYAAARDGAGGPKAQAVSEEDSDAVLDDSEWENFDSSDMDELALTDDEQDMEVSDEEDERDAPPKRGRRV